MNAATKTGTCECCGKDDIKESQLVRIDSGQLFCPQCLHALRSSEVR
jgi:late competence protein required for DNA uptake (superfamily II DNA/RNA helicase)